MNIIVGHMIGDYLLQSDWMALNKKKSGINGLIACIVHCLIWTVSVYAFCFRQVGSVLVFILLFASHFVLDRTNIIKWYCNATRLMPNPAMWKIILCDNTLHFLMVYLIALFFNVKL